MTAWAWRILTQWKEGSNIMRTTLLFTLKYMTYETKNHKNPYGSACVAMLRPGKRL